MAKYYVQYELSEDDHVIPSVHKEYVEGENQAEAVDEIQRRHEGKTVKIRVARRAEEDAPPKPKKKTGLAIKLFFVLFALVGLGRTMGDTILQMLSGN